MRLEDLFRHVVDAGGSDLILRTTGRPSMRVNGEVRFLSDILLKPAMAEEILKRVLDRRAQELFFKTGEADSAFDVEGAGRFRVNVFRQRGKLGFVCRHVKSNVPLLGDLMLPTDQLIKLSKLHRGIVLVTGIAGSGKSTTLAAMINWLNQNERRHIVTMEDPIEFMFEDQLCTINQREVGVDTLSFAAALKSVVRQAPDVIMVGEMRDQDTIRAALQAAETGHLVFSTLHTVNAVQTVERIISFFEPHHHDLIRNQLAMMLEGVVSQRLIPTSDGEGRIPAVEILLSTPTTRDMLAEGRTRELGRAIHEGAEYFGSMTFNQSLVRLIKMKAISLEDAMKAADNPDELKLELRGISKGTRPSSSGSYDKVATIF
jgi:twitching motility protein PilT